MIRDRSDRLVQSRDPVCQECLHLPGTCRIQVAESVPVRMDVDVPGNDESYLTFSVLADVGTGVDDAPPSALNTVAP